MQDLTVRLSKDCLKLLRTEESSGLKSKKELVPKRPWPLSEVVMSAREREKQNSPGVHHLETKIIAHGRGLELDGL